MGSVLQGQKTGDEYILYLHDENGNTYGFLLKNGTTEAYYYYIFNAQGDVIGILDSAGTQVVAYEYSAWGEVLSVTGTLASTIGQTNPIRYRGYYYDNETGFYYLQSRYYDPTTLRMFNCDTLSILGVAQTLYDKNLFAYCDNNPIIRKDVSGYAWETIFDILTFGASVVEVCINPIDPWAWASLAGDAIDLIPFVTGVGEMTRTIKTTVKVVDEGTDVIEATKTLYKLEDKASDIRKSTGAYEIFFESGYNYVGKGDVQRAMNSATRLQKEHSDKVTRIMWQSAPSDKAAFINEFLMQSRAGGTLSQNKDLRTYNKIASPGKNYYYNELRRR